MFIKTTRAVILSWQSIIKEHIKMAKTKSKKDKPVNTSKLFRMVLDHGDVLSNSLANTVIEEVAASGKFTNSDGTAVKAENLRAVVGKLDADVKSKLDNLITGMQKTLE